MALNGRTQIYLYRLLATLLLSLTFVTGCADDECSQSADCPTGQVCSESGGVFWGGNICVQLTPREDASSGDLDATDAADIYTRDTGDTQAFDAGLPAPDVQNDDTGPADATEDTTPSEDTTPPADVDDVAPVPSCDDGVKNGDETAADCGGATCNPC